MTYESLIAEFRLRVIKTDADYDAAKAFWDERVRLAMKHCRLHDVDGVQEYAEVLAELMSLYEQGKLDECEDEEDFDEEDSDPTEPDEGDWVTEDYRTFFENTEGSKKRKVCVTDDEDWKKKVSHQMFVDHFWPNVWHMSDHGNYTLLILEDE